MPVDIDKENTSSNVTKIRIAKASSYLSIKTAMVLNMIVVLDLSHFDLNTQSIFQTEFVLQNQLIVHTHRKNG
jgi:hypothetical protein